MTERWERLREAALRPTDAAALGVLRIALGLIGFASVVRFFAYGWVDELFLRPKMYFSYWGFSWLPAPSPLALQAVLGALGVLSLFVAAGLFYRAAIVLYALLFTYVELLDVTNYLNHYYLVTWLSLLGCVVPLHRALSVDAKRHGWEPVLPAWCTWLFRFQVGVVYVFAGLAKCNADWLLHAEPLQIWLSARTDTPIVGRLLGETWVAFAMSWAGFLFDATVPFFLLSRRTRPLAYAAVLAFHVATRALFPIGMFPFIMTGAALVFFPPAWPRRFLGALARLPSPSALPRAVSRRAFALGAAAFAAFGLFHVAMPLRTHFYGGDVAWHEQGMRFSWRVMVREKNGSVTYTVRDRDTGRVQEINPRRYLTDRQAREFSGQPDLILQLAHRIADDERRKGRDVAVFADARVSWNGRPAARLVDPTVDLSRVDDGLGKASFILPAPAGPPARLTPIARRLASPCTFAPTTVPSRSRRSYSRHRRSPTSSRRLPRLRPTRHPRPRRPARCSWSAPRRGRPAARA